MICPNCKLLQMTKYYTDADDIVLICRRCQHTQLGDPKERDVSLNKGIANHIKTILDNRE